VTGQTLSFAQTTPAENARFTIDGLTFTRQSNTVTDALPGTTLQLKGETNTVEQLTLDYDATATATNLQKFVDAYNDIVKTASEQLKLGGANSDRASTLAGDSTVRSLISSVQSVVTATVSGLGNVRSLADLGLKTNYQDGLLSIDTTKLTSSIASDAAAVNEIFADTLTGISALAFNLNRKFTSSIGGLFTERTKSLNESIRRLDSDAERMQARLDAFKKNLVMQFTAMEQVVSGLKATGNFLTAQSAQKTT
jgi:flagellar hook-associated protein 2